MLVYDLSRYRKENFERAEEYNHLSIVSEKVHSLIRQLLSRLVPATPACESVALHFQTVCKRSVDIKEIH